MFLHFLRSISIPFGILAYLAQGLQSTYCPVSQQSNFSDFLYPVDIYDCKNGNHQASDFETNNCFSFREKERSDPFINKHNCSFTYKIKCPVDQSLLVNALKRTKAITAYSPICHLKNRLADPNQQINIYILGGSVTGIYLSVIYIFNIHTFKHNFFV